MKSKEEVVREKEVEEEQNGESWIDEAHSLQ